MKLLRRPLAGLRPWRSSRGCAAGGTPWREHRPLYRIPCKRCGGLTALILNRTLEGGTGFSVTPYGEEWLSAADEVDLVPTQPGRFAKMLAQAGRKFGPGFVERAEQSVASYNGQAFMACCAMCGAASESIILALAIAKKGSEEPILRMYAGATGRSRVEEYLLGSQTDFVREEFGRYTGLLKHWRDDSAHGRAVRISEPEAYSALVLLLRFALWAEGRWAELTRASGPSSASGDHAEATST
jgi:hypothetical protein